MVGALLPLLLGEPVTKLPGASLRLHCTPYLRHLSAKIRKFTIIKLVDVYQNYRYLLILLARNPRQNCRSTKTYAVAMS